MRFVILAIAAAFAVSLATSTPGFAAAKSAKTARAESINASFNRCVSLAKERGYSQGDLYSNREAARNFVIRCMQGKQR
jgi:hypothetical protein